MRKFVLGFSVLLAVAASALAQDIEARLKQALEGRLVLVKMDLPASEQGLHIVFDDVDAKIDDARHRSLIKQVGPAIKSGTRARITGVRLTNNVLTIELDGGGSPSPDMIAGRFRLTAPALTAKSEREMELERQLQNETNRNTISFLQNELELERQRRVEQDNRNQAAFARALKLREDHIAENRKAWGSRLNIVIRSKKDPLPFREMARSLSKYAELLPRETPNRSN
jgi:hypothetical protein